MTKLRKEIASREGQNEIAAAIREITRGVLDIERAEVAAENAENSANGASASAQAASTTAEQLTQYLATKQTVTAPAIDPTLSIGGAGADAKITGNISKGLYEHSVYDILCDTPKYNINPPVNPNVVRNADGSWTFNTTGELMYNIYDNGNNFPFGVHAGKTYYVNMPSPSGKVGLDFWYRKNGSLTGIKRIIGQGFVTIPSDAQGLFIRFRIWSDAGNVNETIKPEMYSVEGGMLKGALCNIGGYAELAGGLNYTDANNVDKNCIITCYSDTGHQVSNIPYTTGWLHTIIQDAIRTNFKFQIMYPMFPADRVMYRAFRFGTTWDEWKPISDFSNQGVIRYDSCDDIITDGIVFITKNGANPASIPDFPLNNPGWLQTLSNAGYGGDYWRFQIAYPWSTGGKILYRSYNSSGWTNWVEMGTGGGGDITNNYITNHYESTYTINATPSITADTNNYLPSTGDTTDRKADIQAMLSSIGTCRLGAGDFYVSGINVPAGAMLEGCGNATKIHLLDSVTDGFTVKLNENSTLKDVMLIGSNSNITLSETVGTRHGILWEGNANGDNDSIPYRGTISNVFIKGFNGGGITCYNTGYGINGLNVSDCHIMNCNAAINISYWSEFHRFTNINACGNYYGCINNGGNNMFVNCNFSGNKMGMLMDNSQGQSPNNTHGSAIGCVFNHTDGNNGIGIKILNCNSGFIFEGCQIFFSQIYLENTDGIVVSNSNFGVNNCNITIKNGGAVLFNGNMHQGQPTISITNNNKVHFANCYVRSSGAVVAAS